jgi:hypothetical protein
MAENKPRIIPKWPEIGYHQEIAEKTDFDWYVMETIATDPKGGLYLIRESIAALHSKIAGKVEINPIEFMDAVNRINAAAAGIKTGIGTHKYRDNA